MNSGVSRIPSDEGSRGDAQQIESLLEELQGIAEAPVWERIHRLLDCFMRLYGAGLERTLGHLSAAQVMNTDVEARLCGDEVVSHLLLLHGIHPIPTIKRVQRALDELQPVLGLHSGGVELLEMTQAGTLRLRFTGNCDGCSSSQSTAEHSIRRAIEQAAPEITEVIVEGGSQREGVLADSLVPLRLSRPSTGASVASSETEMASEERCEICAVPLGQEHPHLVDLQRRQLCCACKPCALLFNNPGNEGGRYRAVPDRVLVDSGFELRRSDWTALGMPVGLAFIFFNSTLKRWVLTYPSPAGATESELEGDAWENFRVNTPLFRALEPDVEALLVYGQRGSAVLECFLVPITTCYQLIARVRTHWEGFGGGERMRRELEAFFEEQRKRSRPLG